MRFLAVKKQQYEPNHPPTITPLDEIPRLHRLLNLNPDHGDERSKYEDRSVIQEVLKNPDAANHKYIFFRHNMFEQRYPLIMTIMLGGSLEAVDLLYESCPEAIEETTSYGMTMLHVACWYKASLEVVQFLAEKHPPAVEMKDRFGETPLHRACSCGTPVEVVEMLVEQCPTTLTMEDNNERTPIMCANANNASPEVVSLLATLHCLLLANLSDDQVMSMLLEWDGEMWRCQVAPILRWRTSLVQKMAIPFTLLPTLLESVASAERVETVFRIVRETMELFEEKG